MTADTSPPLARVFYRVIIILFTGVVVCTFSLNGVLRSIAGSLPWPWMKDALLALAAIPDGVYGTFTAGKYFLLELLVRWAILSLAVFIGLLLLNSIRHWTVNIFVAGAGGLFLGLFVLTWMSLFLFLLGILIYCVAFVFGILHWIFTGILAFLLWPPVLFTLVGLGTVVALVIYLRELSLEQILVRMKKLFRLLLSARVLFAVLALAAAVAVEWFVLIPLWFKYIAPLLELIGAWLREYIIPILAWVFSAVGVVILAVLILIGVGVALFLLGVQLLDQLRSARVCGRDIYGAFAAGFSVGAAAGLMLLICSANGDYRAVVNAAWAGTSPVFTGADIVGAVYALMPAGEEALLQALLAKASPPIFDAALLVVTLMLANCSLLMGLLSGAKIEPLRTLLTWERTPVLFKLMFGVLVAFAAAALDANVGQDS